MISVRVAPVTDFAALGVRWRELEARADGSFFQSWAWVGCLVHERFSDPILVEATEGSRTVALALFNRGRRRAGPRVLYLGESGDAALDSPYVEQNGVLAEAGYLDELTCRCLMAVAGSYDLVLSGVGEPVVAAARRAAGLTMVRRTQASPFVDLAEIRRSGGDYLAGRSANTRQQIRRSDRVYRRDGSITVERAASVPAAHAMLAEMAALHQATWQARGKQGCFAEPFFCRFHHALIAEAMARDEIAILKISSCGATIGILYNFVYRGRVLAYQSGFSRSLPDKAAKPGLTCHHAAIQYFLANGLNVYDLLAGEDRYKFSLASHSHTQVWAEAGPVWSPRLLLRRMIRLVGAGG